MIDEPVEQEEVQRVLYLASRYLPALAKISPKNLHRLAGLMYREERLCSSEGKWCPGKNIDTRPLYDQFKNVTCQNVADCISRAMPAIGNLGQPNLKRLKRDIRNAFYTRNASFLNTSLISLRDYFPEVYESGEALDFIIREGPQEWLLKLPIALLAVYAWQIIPVAMRKLVDIRFMEPRLLEVSDRFPPAAIYPLIDYEIFCGNWEKAAVLLKKCSSNNVRLLRKAWLSFMIGRNDKAINMFIDSLYAVRQKESTHDYYFQTISGMFFIFALLREGSAPGLSTAESNTEVAEKIPTWGIIYQSLLRVVRYRKAHEMYETVINYENHVPIIQFFLILCEYWLDKHSLTRNSELVSQLQKMAAAGGYEWLRQECEELKNRCDSDSLYTQKRYHDDSQVKVPFLLDCVPNDDAWSSRLTNLQQFLTEAPERGSRRLSWLVSKNNSGNLDVFPLEQRLNKNGKWSKGRKFTAFRNQNYCQLTYTNDSLMQDFQLSPQDKYVCTLLRNATEQLDADTISEWEARGAIFQALLGHPRVLLDGPTLRPLVCSIAQPYINIRKTEHYLAVQLCPVPFDNEGVIVRHEFINMVNIYLFDDEHMRLRHVLGKEFRLPLTARDEMIAILSRLCQRYPILSEMSLDFSNIPAEVADSKPHIRLIPDGPGLRVEICIHAFPGKTEMFPPGSGPCEMIIHNGQESQRLIRDFDLETKRAEAVVSENSILATSEPEKPWQWFIDTSYLCYELTVQLHRVLDHCTVEWPENKKFCSSRSIGLNSVSLRTTSYKDWFSLEGTVELDENQTITLQELLVKSHESKNRFITLDDGQVIALSEAFRTRLDDLHRLGEFKEDGFCLHQFLYPLFGSLLDDFGKVEQSEEWLEQRKELDQRMSMVPEVSKDLKADLRQYQREGYTWLSRLDALGTGACLADDMGLGKTIQVIALMLDKADEGASLVIAPTSVCANWEHELAVFAPSLHVTIFGPGDRAEMLASMSAGDVLICSYGLLQSTNSAFKNIQWRIAVLDEAQAIKNYNAKRSQAALQINAKFRVATTGTPVENNLNEIWSIFRFINPFLLGTRDQFQQRFAIPIERGNDKEASDRLNALLHPFLLRRCKEQVLKELPPKTEINFDVELSDPEREFYNTLRKNILNDLESSENPKGRMRIRVLAGITRLRLATCHPSLVSGGENIVGSKLEAFLDLIQNILAGGHKALVFSQFVKFLTVVRHAMEAKGIQYEYLDGSMSPKDRQASVENFQAGKVPTFLISLKAGGLGLNLTEADYVIHLDSWWNPAVGKQASDRAHRLGQDKPVTIYHLNAKNTIEDKIQALHKWKRDLADQLLAGNDTLETLSVDDLLSLLKEY